MLTQILKKPTKFFDNFKHGFRPTQQNPLILPAPAGKGRGFEQTWGKLRYTQWIENVKLQFHKGDYVALRQLPQVVGHPPMTFIIEDINELHYLAYVDQSRADPQPKAIGITLLGGKGAVIWRCPADLRHLTMEEEAMKEKLKGPLHLLKAQNDDNTTVVKAEEVESIIRAGEEADAIEARAKFAYLRE